MNIFSNTMADMKWTDIKRYADENAIVLLPIGVIEEHGPHLCLATDIYTKYYPHLVDTDKAKSLPDVSLDDRFEAWMFSGQLQQISAQGYIGSPSSYLSVDIDKNIEDYALRISDAIISRITG